MPACPEDRTGDEQALDDLPVALAVALRLHRAGADRRLIGIALGIEPGGVEPLVQIAEAKLRRLRRPPPSR